MRQPSTSACATAPGRASIYFRGVADDSTSYIADSSAAIYLDEQPLTQSALQPEIRLVDIERIEALPGPQGTLYGSSSQSGTLRYITNKPDPGGFYADVSLDGHSVDEGDEGYEASGVLNLPLGENSALRLVGFSARDAGFIDNVLGESLGGGFDNAEFVDEDVNAVDIQTRAGRHSELLNSGVSLPPSLSEGASSIKTGDYGEDDKRPLRPCVGSTTIEQQSNDWLLSPLLVALSLSLVERAKLSCNRSQLLYGGLVFIGCARLLGPWRLCL